MSFNEFEIIIKKLVSDILISETLENSMLVQNKAIIALLIYGHYRNSNLPSYAKFLDVFYGSSNGAGEPAPIIWKSLGQAWLDIQDNNYKGNPFSL
jgi:hypothetical protein